MSDAYSELGGRAETYEEALARCIVLRPAAAKTEAEIAADIVAAKAKLAHHDEMFSHGFITPAGMKMVSIETAKKMGSQWNYSEEIPE